MNQEKLKKAKYEFFIALGIDIVITALVVISDFWVAGVLNDVRSGSGQLDQSTISSIDFWSYFGWSTTLTTIGVGITLILWMGQCYEYAKETLKATGFAQERWKTLGWIVPFFNIFKPYQVLSEIYKVGAAGYVGGNEWKKSPGSGWLLSWWFFWVFIHWFMWFFVVIERTMTRSIPYTLSLNRAIDIYHINLAIFVCSLIVVGLWFRVVGVLTQRLFNRSDRIMPVPLVGTKVAAAGNGNSSIIPTQKSSTIVQSLFSEENL